MSQQLQSVIEAAWEDRANILRHPHPLKCVKP